METSDIQLIEEYLKGDEGALKVLIGRYLKPVFNFICHYAGGSRQEAEDLTQETFVKAWKNLKKFDSSKTREGKISGFKPWIFKIAKNTAFDYLRKRYSADRQKKLLLFSELGGGGESESDFLENIPDGAPLPDEIFDQADLAKKLSGAIEKLPIKYREVLILHYNDHFNLREIAEISGESINTVKSRHLRALNKLKGLLESHPNSNLTRIK